jgi:hypothetical protein
VPLGRSPQFLLNQLAAIAFSLYPLLLVPPALAIVGLAGWGRKRQTKVIEMHVGQRAGLVAAAHQGHPVAYHDCFVPSAPAHPLRLLLCVLADPLLAF